MGNSKSSSAEEAQPSPTSTNEPGPGVFQDAGGEAEGEAEGEENSRRPEKFWNNDFLPLYELLPYPITPPEGWAKYKSEKKRVDLLATTTLVQICGGGMKKKIKYAASLVVYRHQSDQLSPRSGPF